MRGNAAHVLATCAMQNLAAARPLLAAGALDALMARLRVESDAFAASKLLSAVSAVCGDDAGTLQQLVVHGGVPALRAFLLHSQPGWRARQGALRRRQVLSASRRSLPTPCVSRASCSLHPLLPH